MAQGARVDAPDMTAAAELIEFKRVSDHANILYISNIPPKFHEGDLQEKLEGIFSQFGLLYEVALWTPRQNEQPKQHEQGGEEFPKMLAVVKFYSARAAATALKQSAGRRFLKGSLLKVQYSRRKKTSWDDLPLYVTKCYELANYYLGFNGWITKIIDMKAVVSDEVGDISEPARVTYTCRAQVQLPQHHLVANGHSVTQMPLLDTGLDAKGTAICRARKRAYHNALEDAFSKIVLVVLPNGKVHPEVNTTLEEAAPPPNAQLEGLVQVRELDTEPEKEDDQDDLDEINEQILQELESGW